VARRPAARVALATAIASPLGWLLLGATPAAAQQTGPCTASLNGVTPEQASTPGSAVRVGENDVATVSAQVPSGPVAYRVELMVPLPFAKVTWTAKQGQSNTNTWSSGVSIHNYARYGTGLYRIRAVSTAGGVTCTAEGYVRVVGSGVSLAGAVAAGVAAVGAMGVAAATMAAGRGRGLPKVGRG
jgi:hypothetical protein